MKTPERLRLGVAPTRRVIFSIEEAARQKRLIEASLKSFGVDFVPIDEVNPEGLIFSRNHVEPALHVLRREKVDALFIPHVNFGTEDATARLARDLGKPVLLWGPRDDAPEPDGSRSRDTQCGLFATSKILRRMNVPFSYIVNSTPDSPVFERGVKNFVAAAAAVKAFRNARIGQISTRPAAFWTMMVNEGELLERWGIEVVPATLSDILRSAQRMIDSTDPAVADQTQWIREHFEGHADEGDLRKVAAFKLALSRWAEEAQLDAIALQCWSALQADFGIFPCFVHGLITDEGVPLACETDIHGALASYMVQEAVGRTTATFFADLTIRHPKDENAELLWHCGPFPPSLAIEGKPRKFSGHYMAGKGKPPLAVGEWQLRGGPVTIARFDGDHGHYQLFLGHAQGTQGPFTRGTYLWVKVGNWPLWEERLIQGPYVHHVVCVHGQVVPALYEACRFLGIQPDCVEPTESEIQAWLRGEPWPGEAPARPARKPARRRK